MPLLDRLVFSVVVTSEASTGRLDDSEDEDEVKASGERLRNVVGALGFALLIGTEEDMLYDS